MKQCEIRFKLPQKTYDNLKAFGEEHGMRSARTERIMPNTVAANIVRHVLRLHGNEKIKKIKEREGGTTLDLITRAVHRHFLA